MCVTNTWTPAIKPWWITSLITARHHQSPAKSDTESAANKKPAERISLGITLLRRPRSFQGDSFCSADALRAALRSRCSFISGFVQRYWPLHSSLGSFLHYTEFYYFYPISSHLFPKAWPASANPTFSASWSRKDLKYCFSKAVHDLLTSWLQYFYFPPHVKAKDLLFVCFHCLLANVSKTC